MASCSRTALLICTSTLVGKEGCQLAPASSRGFLRIDHANRGQRRGIIPGMVDQANVPVEGSTLISRDADQTVKPSLF